MIKTYSRPYKIIMNIISQVQTIINLKLALLNTLTHSQFLTLMCFPWLLYLLSWYLLLQSLVFHICSYSFFLTQDFSWLYYSWALLYLFENNFSQYSIWTNHRCIDYMTFRAPFLKGNSFFTGCGSLQATSDSVFLETVFLILSFRPFGG